MNAPRIISRSRTIVGLDSPLQRRHERRYVQARLLFGEQRLGGATAAQGAQPTLAVLVGVVGKRARAARTQSPLGEVDLGTVLLERRDQLVDALRRW